MMLNGNGASGVFKFISEHCVLKKKKIEVKSAVFLQRGLSFLPAGN